MAPAFEAELLLVGRLLFGLLFIYNGYNHFANYGGTVQYAEFKGVPTASVLVPLSGAILLLGGLGIVLGIYPVVAAAGIVVFLAITTPLIHDFWTASDEERVNEFNHFLKNVGLLGAALVLLVLGTETWEYGVNIGLF